MQLVASVALVWGAVYLTWRVGWTGAGAQPVSYWFLVGAELFGWVSLALYVVTAWRVPTSTRPPITTERSVDVFVCTYDEPVEVVHATLAGCVALHRPHRTHLLDDGRRPEMHRLAERLGVDYLTRPDNAHAKAGNINAALPRSEGELIAILDADHVPMPDLLDATLGYFEDPEVGLVQTPHDFYNCDSVQRTKECRSSRRSSTRSSRRVRTASTRSSGVVRGRCSAGARSRRSVVCSPTRWRRTSTRRSRCTLADGSPATTTRPSSRVWPPDLVLLAVLLVTLTTGLLPLHATALGLLGFWLPWTVLAFTATPAVARGTLGPGDSTRYGLLTMGIFTRAAASLVVNRRFRFRVTPKQGIDHGGVAVLRALPILTLTAVALALATSLRVVTWSGVGVLPELSGLALAATLAIAGYELVYLGVTLVPLLRRRQLRTRWRVPVALWGTAEGERVRILDLSPDGFALDVPASFDGAESLTLHLELPDAWGEVAPARIGATVASRVPTPSGRLRLGCHAWAVDPVTYDRLVAYCYVVSPFRRLRGVDAPVNAPAPPGPVPSAGVAAVREAAQPADDDGRHRGGREQPVTRTV